MQITIDELSRIAATLEHVAPVGSLAITTQDGSTFAVRAQAGRWVTEYADVALGTVALGKAPASAVKGTAVHANQPHAEY